MPGFPNTSPHADSLTDSVFSDLLAEARKRQQEQKNFKVYPLHVGDTYLQPVVDAQLNAIDPELFPDMYRYGAVSGDKILVDAIINKTKAQSGIELESRNIQVVAGATSGLSIAVNTIIDPGDDVLLLAPYWPLIRGIIACRGARPVEVAIFDRLQDPTYDWMASLEQSLTPHTKAIYINSPNNPTGTCLTAPQIEQLASFVKKHKLWVLSDEAYEDLWFEQPNPRVWAHPELIDHSIVIHTLSKSYGMAGVRVGYIHGPKQAMKGIRAVQTYQTYNAARPMQIIAAKAINAGNAWQQQARANYQRAAKLAADTLHVPTPQVGTFLFFDTTPFVQSGKTLADFLHRCLEKGVLLTPGSASGQAYQSWARLCFTCLELDELEQAMEQLSSALKV